MTPGWSPNSMTQSFNTENPTEWSMPTPSRSHGKTNSRYGVAHLAALLPQASTAHQNQSALARAHRIAGGPTSNPGSQAILPSDQAQKCTAECATPYNWVMVRPSHSPPSDALGSLGQPVDARGQRLIVSLAIASWIAFLSIKGGVKDADTAWHLSNMILRLLAWPTIWFGIYRASGLESIERAAAIESWPWFSFLLWERAGCSSFLNRPSSITRRGPMACLPRCISLQRAS